jgi:hypothetical protein
VFTFYSSLGTFTLMLRNVGGWDTTGIFM